jgi:putative SOS response-associated peptidase YedK
MCFYSKQTKQAVELENRFNAKVTDMALFETKEKINGFSHVHTPIITHQDPKLIQFYNWGLIPHWAKDTKISNQTLNARIETLHEKPSYKSYIKNRCLILADGFYEWQWLDDKGKQKQQYLIALPNNEAFAFAGIYCAWTDKSNGTTLHTYTIVTTEANPLMAEIHNTKKRMPVILTPENEHHWLNNQPVEAFAECTIELKATPIS